MTAILNDWAAAWTTFMWRGVVDSALVLAILLAVWMPLRRRMPAQVGYCLFLLVLLKVVVPLSLPVPGWLAFLSPRHSVEALTAWVATPSLRTIAVGGGESSVDQESVELGAATHRFPGHGARLGFDDDGAKPSISPPSTPSAPPLSLTAMLTLGWLATVTALVVRLAYVQWRMQRLIRQATPVDSSALPVDFQALRRLAGVRQPVQLVASPALGVPAVWGLFRPRLVVPPHLLGQLSSNQLTWVLLHELAHIRRADLVVALVQRIAQIVYFFNPAVWLANWLIDQQREFACDDEALAACSFPRRDCGQGFLRIVELANLQPIAIAPALGLFDGALTYKTFIRSRLMRILDTRRPVNPRLSRTSAALLVALAVLLLPQVRAQPKAANRRPAVDETAQPANQTGQAAALAANPVVKEIPWPFRDGNYNQQLSPDGKRLALNGPFKYSDGTPGGVEPGISILDLATNRETTIVQTDRNRVWSPRWSPVEGQVAYTDARFDRTVGRPVFSIRIVPTSGGEPRIVFQRSENFFPVDWSRDGKWILAGLWTGDSFALSFIPVEGGGERELVAFGTSNDAHYGSISPGGDVIVYKRMLDNKLRLCVMELASRREIAVDSDLEFGWYPNPVWSADGRYVLFAGSPGDGHRNIYAQRVKGQTPDGQPLLITRDAGTEQLIALNDGRLLYSTVDRALPKLFAVSIDSQTGQVQGKPALVNDRFAFEKNSDILLSPDGQWLVGRARKEGTADVELCITRVDGSQTRYIPTGLKGFRVCGWSPDGKSLVVHGSTPETKEKTSHFRVDLDTGAAQMLFSPQEGGGGRLSLDGQRLAFGIRRDGVGTLNVSGVQPGAQPMLLRRVPGENSAAPTWSPDGRSIAFLGINSSDKSKRRLLVISADGEEARELAPAGANKPTNDFAAWSPDGKFVAYNNARPSGGGAGIWLVRPEGGEPIYLDLGVQQVFSHTWTNDGKLLFTGTNESDKSHLWSLENYLPAE